MRHWSSLRSARKQKNINKAFGETKGKSSYNREIESKSESESESESRLFCGQWRWEIERTNKIPKRTNTVHYGEKISCVAEVRSSVSFYLYQNERRLQGIGLHSKTRCIYIFTAVNNLFTCARIYVCVHFRLIICICRLIRDAMSSNDRFGERINIKLFVKWEILFIPFERCKSLVLSI